MTATVQQPLSGFTALVTRPAGQGDNLLRLIAEAGGQAVHGPLLSIAPVADTSAAVALLTQPEGWDWIIFISTNAVRNALAMDARIHHVLLSSRLAAVGEATAAELESAGLPVILTPHLAFSSEALLEDPRMSQVSGHRILIVRGEGGREHLAEVLQERGAMVAYAEVYRRVPVATEVFRPFLTVWPERGYDAVIVTSGEALTRLTGLLDELDFSGQSRPTLIVPSQRIARLACEQGWPAVLVAEPAGDEATAQALKRLAHAHRTGQVPVGLILNEQPVIGPESSPSAPVSSVAEESHHDLPAQTVQDFDGDTPLTDQEKNTQPVADSTAEKTPKALPTKGSADPGNASKPKKSRGLAWIGYAMLLGVIALAVGGWFLLQELRSRQEGLGGQISDKSQQVQEVTHQVTSVQSELAALHSQIATLQNQFSNSDAKINRLLSEQGEQIDVKLQSTRGELAASIQQIQRQLNQKRGDLLIADAEYLLSVANQKLNLVGDVKSVLAAMEAADQRLHESSDPAVYKVREVLAQEMGALRKIQPPDLVGVSSRLVALEKKVATLPLVLPHAGTPREHEQERDTEKQNSAATPEENTGDAFDNALESIKDLVTVRRTDKPIEAVLTPQQVEAIRELLLLKLENSRSALLRNDEQLYRDSLATAADWVNQHFDTAAAETRSMLDELAVLGDRAFNVVYPDISKSMVMLQNIEKLRLESEDEILHGKHVIKPEEPAREPSPSAGKETPESQDPVGAHAKDAKGSKTEKQPPGKKGKVESKGNVTPAGEATSPEPAAMEQTSTVPAQEPAEARKTPEPAPSADSPPASQSPELPVQTLPAAPTVPDEKPATESGERL